jgi:hypothetical protein
MTGRIPIRAAVAALATVAASAALAAPANAGIVTTSATGCDTPSTSRVFARYLDPMSYMLAPGGAFEDGAEDWALTGGARVVQGNEPAHITAAGDAKSLSLPAGSSATTPPICVGLGEPTLRFFARRNSGLLSVLSVSVNVQTSLGVWVTLPNGVDLGGGWHPSAPMPVIANLLPLLPPDKTAVRFTFAPTLGGDWQIDDVYVDPMHRA